MPIRKYLRISRRAVLELRIYIDGWGAEADSSWFTRAMLEEAVRRLRPLVKPKLREERDKKRKKTATKDDIDGDGWRGSVFLVDVTTRHVVLKARRQLSLLKTDGRRGSGPTEPRILIEEEEVDGGIGHGPLFNNEDDEDEEEQDVKQKPVLNATYDGFHIWGKAICLLVSSTAPAPQQQMQQDEPESANTAARRRPNSAREGGANVGNYAQIDRWLSSQLPPDTTTASS